MAHDASDTRLRRAPIGKADPPVGTVIGSDAISAPLPVENGIVHGSSNAANEQSAVQRFDDLADTVKVDRPPAHPGGAPFELKR